MGGDRHVPQGNDAVPHLDARLFRGAPFGDALDIDPQAADPVLEGVLGVLHIQKGDSQGRAAPDITVIQQLLHRVFHGVHRDGKAQALDAGAGGGGPVGGPAPFR